jgi:hypothetical protein
MALKCTKIGDDWLVDLGVFRLRFSKSLMGISSFAYLKGGDWHEAVNPQGSGILYLPRLTVLGISGGPIYPYCDGDLVTQFLGKAFARIDISGYLSNATQGTGFTDYHFETRYSIYEDGDIHLKTTIDLSAQASQAQVTEEHILDPRKDNDITLERDTAPNLWFAGFHSNNTGDSTSDLSHDGILVQFGDVFNTYVTYTDGDRNAVGLTKDPELWTPGSSHTRYFRMHLSANGSPNDITGSGDFQEVGDDKGADFRNPDPLTGGPNEGDVLTGSLEGDGYDEAEGTYTFNAA